MIKLYIYQFEWGKRENIDTFSSGIMNTLQVVFTTVLNMSITASLVAIGVIIARLMLKKMPRILSYALWSAVLIRLVFPVSFTSPFSLLTVIKPGTQQTTEAIAYVPYANARY